MARPVAHPDRPADPPEELAFFLFPLSRKQAAFDIALILAAALFLEVLTALIAGFVVGSRLGDPATIPPEVQRHMLFPMIAVRAGLAVSLVAAFVVYRKQSLSAVGLRRHGLALDGVLGFALTFVVYGLIALAFLLLMAVWTDVPKQMQENASALLALIPGSHPLVLLGMSVVIGAYEELLFRGFLLPRLRRASGSWFWAVVLSSAVFTALHAAEQTPAALVIVAILSVSFSVVTIWRRSIVPAIVAHSLFDFSQFLLLTLQKDAGLG